LRDRARLEAANDGRSDPLIFLPCLNRTLAIFCRCNSRPDHALRTATTTMTVRALKQVSSVGRVRFLTI
jgi:hypothetical protein